ncbi:uncharacterized protein BDR25DRAFT_237443 [Lindgomyces ingoldianus]|uniref:Uncharacterized protein n=1 Tax=Lindgomyces ingoldianus TaxID=673940 RepID=A0ACB6QHH9_9PLEO|nr:uncharacterized protein BDR25DRAFT_237443 [Lindgomyces ingoldianus]KAF2466331.1 hypothetical protein BDR25DRAFT_237443 [Lindgomyces ingoldianus]
MQQLSDFVSQSPLLALPRELRDEIYSYMVLPQHVYTATPKPSSHSLHRSRLAARLNSNLEESIESAKDDGSVRITVEILVLIRGSMGSYIPSRDKPSPRFLAMLPLLRHLKKVKFLVWGGWDFWFGPPKRRPGSGRHQKALPSVEQNPLSIALKTLMSYLPNVEEVNIDLLMHIRDYWNLDLPDIKWAGIEGWLLEPIYQASNVHLRKVHRRLMACNADNQSATFYHKLEIRNDLGHSNSRLLLHTSEGTGEVS